ncbi:MAG: NTP transferase domain-containing protein [Candidatus Baltobacteraceae bacterium]
MKLTTIVLAGGKPDEVAATQAGAPNKAFIEIAGKPLVTRTLEALRRAPSVGRIIVVAPPAAHALPALALSDERRPDGVRIRDSLSNGLRDLPPDDDIFVSASDLPILSTICIETFLRDAVAEQAELTYAILERNNHERAFPEVPHTWAKLRDGTYCGGGFITLKPRVWPLLAEFIERLGAARKNPLRLASLFGWDVLLRFAVRRLSVSDAQNRASAILGARVRAVVSGYPEMAVNVDRVSDIALAQRLITAGSTSG